MLTPGPYRGFSGEGSLLELLTHPDAERVGRTLLDHLAWEPLVDPDGLAAVSGHDRASVDAGLAWLSSSGRLGYDIDAARWFHRELPVDADRILRDNPRLRSARAITGLVRHGETWRVPGTHGRYRVTPARGPMGVHLCLGGGAPRHPRPVQARARGGARRAGSGLTTTDTEAD